MTMATNSRQLFITALSFIGAICVASGYTCTYFGAGSTLCRLPVVQDVWIARPTINYNNWDIVMVGASNTFPLNRFLLQFEDLASTDCTTITDAYMYVDFAYSHRARWETADETPYLTQDIQLHVVSQPWLEDEATSTMRLDGVAWDSTLLALDGTDAESTVLTTETMPMGSPYSWVRFKVTDAVKDWADGTKDNNGLLVKLVDEVTQSRSLRFHSNGYTDDTSKHAYINVICT